MSYLIQFWNNPIVLPALTAWFVAQFLKTLINWRIQRKFDLQRMWGSGGMPSSHTSLTICAATMIGFVQGFDTPLFATAVILAFIVMYDASGVRLETGKQAKILNELITRIFTAEEVDEALLKELIGHKPIEVFCGAVLGVLVAWVFHYWL